MRPREQSAAIAFAQSRKGTGQCSFCGTQTGKTVDYATCEECMLAQTENSRRRRERLATIGACIQCGNAERVEPHLFCADCRKHKVALNSAARKRRKAEGLCIDCGKVQAMSRCPDCAERARRYIRRWRARKVA